jgi:TetR/AcrR family transcriptional regulator, regulator of cefoperazone and chloramphenicol sensitivity
MIRREDGEKSRCRLLSAACDIFSEKGYRDSKVAAICKRAGANGAAVNYYFGNKACLYVEAWRHAYKESAPGLPPGAETDPPAAPEARLHLYIHHLIREFSNKSKIGQLNRLFLLELVNPTGLIDDILIELFEPRRRFIQTIIRDLAGPQASHQQVVFCEMSIMNQCRIFLTVSHTALERLIGQPMTAPLIHKMADHITRFSLAGIQTICAHHD